jgi:cytochrome b involved in lipid metabolism
VTPTTEPIKEGIEEAPVIQQATGTPANAVPNDIKTVENDAIRSYTATEVATHKNGLSCWMILDNKVYDVTSFISKHPNDAILKGCGKDATQMFARHPESAKEMKEQFYIGELKL